ncbi:MAG: DUF2779 domain-containing protein [Bacteroidota bacterium]
MLSKSKYTRGMNCQKSLWLYVHKKDEREVDEAIQAIYARGTSVGELARDYFPNGKMAVLEDYPCFESAKRTQEFIRQGIETIYEATFIFNDTLVAVDILHKHEGKWGLYEVKSTNSTKQQHIKDVAIQYYVVEGSGLDLEDAFLMHFDREYIRRGDIEVNKLFLPESVLKQILTMQQEIPVNILSLQQMLKGTEPNIEIGDYCTSPYSCDFYVYCSKLVSAVEEEIIELSSKPEVLQSEVKAFVEKVQYPLCHLDFETIMPAIPMFDESRPYQQITFQYSLHSQEIKGGEIKHDYYLAENDLNIDPRKGLIKQMIEQTKNAKTIFVYYIGFEGARMNEMKKDFPEYAMELDSIKERLVDLIIPFKQKFYRTETMEGSSSIKKVLPALCPELSYNELEIGNGMAASNSFLDLYYCDDKEVIKKTRENLLKYCHLDTLAMVKIFDVLQKV